MNTSISQILFTFTILVMMVIIMVQADNTFYPNGRYGKRMPAGNLLNGINSKQGKLFITYNTRQ